MAFVAAPTDVRFEHRTDQGPVLGIGTARPRLSWIIPEANPSFVQDAYEIKVTGAHREPQTFRVESREQVLVPWPSSPLGSRESVTVRVRVSGNGRDSDWSEPATVEAGLLGVDDWTARFVSPRDLGAMGAPAPVLRSAIDLPTGIVSARLYATAHGLYLATLNGQRVGDHQLAPGWTSYSNRLRYQTYDVTDLVREGPNELEVLLGNGWYRGRLGWGGRRAVYGDRLALLAQLEVTTSDGTVHLLATDGSWTAQESGILADDLYDGQRTDLRLIERRTGGVEVADANLSRLVAPDGPPVRITETLPAAKVLASPSGATLVDFGQNVVGWVRLTVRDQQPGSEIAVRHAEVLEHGELGVRPLRSAMATDSYILAGDQREVLEPSMTFHGFRYAEVSGLSGLEARDAEAVVIGSDRAGRAGSPHRTRCSTVSTRTSCGGCAATSSTCRPIARSGTNGWAGPETSRSSHRPRRSSSTVPASSRRGSPTWRRSSSRTVPSRSWSPTSLAARVRPLPRGETLPRWCPGWCTSALAMPASSPGSSRACAHGSTGSPTWPVPTGCGAVGSSSGTGWTRALRPRTRVLRRLIQMLSPRPISYGLPRSLAWPRAWSTRSRWQEHMRTSRARCGPPLRAST